jgi:hypothetical protein
VRRGVSWALAVVLTLATAVFQRMTGPSHPARGKVSVGGAEIGYRLPRSAVNDRDGEVSVRVADTEVTGYVMYRRFKTQDAWARTGLERRGDRLVGFLPRQPAAGKLAYRVILEAGGRETSVTGEAPVALRFKRPVPTAVLVVHVFVMFASMLFAAMAGMTALDRKRNPRAFALAAAGLFFVGGFLLGPIVQKCAFGVWWSGFPFGTDLTDNKSLLTMALWVVALAAGRKGRAARGWILAASLATLVINLIPHSLFGSELKVRGLKAP